MGLYTSLAATATRLLAAYGQTWYLGADERTVNGVRVKRSSNRLQTNVLGADFGAENGDIEFILEATAVPLYSERLTNEAGTENYIVMSIDPIQPGPTVLAWLVKVREG